MPIHEQNVQQMLRDIEMEVRLTCREIGREAFAANVMRAMREVPRYRFVPEGEYHRAYQNGPLPIGHGQTISQPYIVALMSDLLELDEHAKVLEIGTGSGYQSAVLACLARRVYSIETVHALVEPARERLAELGYDNIEIKHGNGYYGWLEHAPYDGIIVTAAAPHVPPALIEQLKPGARLVIPVGHPWLGQMLKVIRKQEDGSSIEDDILPVAFVPLTGVEVGKAN